MCAEKFMRCDTTACDATDLGSTQDALQLETLLSGPAISDDGTSVLRWLLIANLASGMKASSQTPRLSRFQRLEAPSYLRGVHEISPMKAANGGVLYTLFNYSHPHLLGGRTSKRKAPIAAGTLEPSVPPSRTQETSQRHCATAEEKDGVVNATETPPTAETAADGDGVRGSATKPLSLPRTLVVHGTADATVPFAQSAELAAVLKAHGVPTVSLFEHGGKLAALRRTASIAAMAYFVEL